MNDARRKKLQLAVNHLSDAKNLIEEIKQEEEESYENMPDSMKEGDKGSKAQEIIDALDSACNSADEAETNVEQAME